MFAINTQPLVEEFLSWKIQRNQDGEAESFRTNLSRFLRYIEEHKPWVGSIGHLSRRDIEDYIVYLRTVEYESPGQKAYRNSFVYRNLRGLDKFLEYLAIHVNQIDSMHLPQADLIHKADFPAPNQRGVKHFPVWLDKLMLLEIRRLPESTVRQLRFKTMMMVIYHTGTRIKDVSTIEVDCVIKKLGYNWLRILSNKTKRYYEVPINNEVYRYLTMYREVVGQPVELPHPTTKQMTKFLFVIRGTTEGLKWSFGKFIRDFGAKVKLKAQDDGLPVEDIEDLSLTSHKYRHNVGIKLIRMGADPLLVAEFLGHTNLAMAQAYIQEDEQEIEEVLNELISDDSLGLNNEEELLDSVILTENDVLNHCGIVSKVDGGWCTHFGDHPPCGEAAYECWKCESLRPDFEDKHYYDRLIKLLEDHEMLKDRNIKLGLLGAAKAEGFVIDRIKGFIKEVEGGALKKKTI